MNDYVRYLIKGTSVAIAVVIAATSSKGINYGDDLLVLFTAVLFLSVLNIVLKPLLVFLVLPFIVLTLGFGFWFINALLFLLVGALVPGFEVHGFLSALWGAFCVSVAAMIAEIFLSRGIKDSAGRPKVIFRSRIRKPMVSRRKIGDDDVIDV